VVAQHPARDLRIGAAGKVVRREIAGEAVDRLQRVRERIARRAAVGDQSAVDVEQNQPHEAVTIPRTLIA
jgi:hypothetical protein